MGASAPLGWLLYLNGLAARLPAIKIATKACTAGSAWQVCCRLPHACLCLCIRGGCGGGVCVCVKTLPEETCVFYMIGYARVCEGFSAYSMCVCVLGNCPSAGPKLCQTGSQFVRMCECLCCGLGS